MLDWSLGLGPGLQVADLPKGPCSVTIYTWGPQQLCSSSYWLWPLVYTLYIHAEAMQQAQLVKSRYFIRKQSAKINTDHSGSEALSEFG